MLFNSIDFAVFLPLVFLIYWFATQGNIKKQNILLVVASYIFYGWWDWRFLSLIFFSTVVDFLIGRRLGKESNHRKRKGLLLLSLIVNLGFLGFFKYYNFFLDNFIAAFSFFGQDFTASSLKVILPVGISFYTFQTLSYSIDVYRKKMEPTKSFLVFSAFVSFFPQLVAGPIERATHLLPQFVKKRKFEYGQAVDGLRQILWGFFKKIIIADSCAPIVNDIFNNSGDYSGSTLLVGAILFAFQIYGDFSGYSDIAIGTARLFGFDLKQNFAFPYFSRDISEFWRRWHISLSTWFRDYLYIPLGGSKGGKWLTIRNVFIIFIVSGFWHGANWTFIAWGTLHALLYLPLLVLNRNRANLGVVAENSLFPSFREVFSMLFTFAMVVLAWVFFRADTIGHAVDYIARIASPSLLSVPETPKGMLNLLRVVLFPVVFILIEWAGRKDQYALETLGFGWHPYIRRAFYFILALVILLFSGTEEAFIYFQF
jgi:D-alanyl-lipoteichoic acid acyltransferase DltB (MBOAT superfamily)